MCYQLIVTELTMVSTFGPSGQVRVIMVSGG